MNFPLVSDIASTNVTSVNIDATAEMIKFDHCKF